MQQVEDIFQRTVLLNPQPREDAEIPPMVESKQSQGVVTVRKTTEEVSGTTNILGSLSFGSR
jgi:hypothetical protein